MEGFQAAGTTTAFGGPISRELIAAKLRRLDSEIASSTTVALDDIGEQS